MPTDPVLTVYKAIADLMTAEPTLYDATGKVPDLVRPGNFIRFDGDKPYAQKPVKVPGDCPQLVLDDGPFQDSGYTKTQTFATFQTGGPPAWKELFQQTFVATLTMPDTRLSPAYVLRDAVALALRKGGPRLGQTFVQQWGPLAVTSQSLNNDQTGGAPRRVMKISIPVVFNYDGQTLV